MASPLKPEAFDRIERADLSRSLPAESTVRSAGSDSSSAHPASSHHRGIAASASSLSLSSEEPGEMEPPLWLEDARARGRSVHRPRAQTTNAASGGGAAGLTPAALMRRELRAAPRALQLFNGAKSGEKAIKELAKAELLGAAGDREVADFLVHNDGKLDPAKVGDLLGTAGQGEALRLVMEALSFRGLPLDSALRRMISFVKLPGEAQKIDRIIEAFAKFFYETNSEEWDHPDTCYMIAFSLTMLNTDAHNDNIRKDRKMTLDQYCRNLRGSMKDGTDPPRSLLAGFYERVTRYEWQVEERLHMQHVHKGWLTKPSAKMGRADGSRRKFCILSSRAIYLYRDEPDMSPTAYIPLEGMAAFPSRRDAKSFELRPVGGSTTKGVNDKGEKVACMIKLVEGSDRSVSYVPSKQTVLTFVAESEKEARAWLHSIRDFTTDDLSAPPLADAPAPAAALSASASAAEGAAGSSLRARRTSSFGRSKKWDSKDAKAMLERKYDGVAKAQGLSGGGCIACGGASASGAGRHAGAPGLGLTTFAEEEGAPPSLSRTRATVGPEHGPAAAMAAEHMTSIPERRSSAPPDAVEAAAAAARGPSSGADLERRSARTTLAERRSSEPASGIAAAAAAAMAAPPAVSTGGAEGGGFTAGFDSPSFTATVLAAQAGATFVARRPPTGWQADRPITAPAPAAAAAERERAAAAAAARERAAAAARLGDLLRRCGAAEGELGRLVAEQSRRGAELGTLDAEIADGRREIARARARHGDTLDRLRELQAETREAEAARAAEAAEASSLRRSNAAARGELDRVNGSLRRAHAELDEAKAALAEVGLRIAAEKRALADLRANREAQLRSSSQVATAGQRLALSLTASQEIHRRLVRLTSSSDAIAALSATTGVSSPGATAASSPSSLRKAGAPPKAASVRFGGAERVGSFSDAAPPADARLGWAFGSAGASFYAAPADDAALPAPLAALLAAAEATAAESGGALRAVDGAAPAAALAAGRVALMWGGPGGAVPLLVWLECCEDTSDPSRAALAWCAPDAPRQPASRVPLEHVAAVSAGERGWAAGVDGAPDASVLAAVGWAVHPGGPLAVAAASPLLLLAKDRADRDLWVDVLEDARARAAAAAAEATSVASPSTGGTGAVSGDHVSERVARARRAQRIEMVEKPTLGGGQSSQDLAI